MTWSRILRNSIFIVVCLIGLAVRATPLLEGIDSYIDKTKGATQKRFLSWRKVIEQAKYLSIEDKLKNVNQYFNLYSFQSDKQYQGLSDIWKTPEEFVMDGGGDCEDYAIAKYFTLLGLGIPMQRLRITYVKSLKLNQAHMVLAYYPTPNSEPYILDNLDSKIRKASVRKDLVPVYSFNTNEVWLARPMGSDRYLGNNNLKKWQSVLQRMRKEGKDHETIH
jgi:predicted transglutaminase-like cysteine proteinase